MLGRSLIEWLLDPDVGLDIAFCSFQTQQTSNSEGVADLYLMDRDGTGLGFGSTDLMESSPFRSDHFALLP